MSILFALLLSSDLARPLIVSEPLEGPVVSAIIKVRQELNGQCSEVNAGLTDGAAAIRMTDICHGWSSHACPTSLLIRAQGVTVDAAQVLFLREDRKADLEALIDAQIGKVWPGNELFNLTLTNAGCSGGAMIVNFDGARVRKGGNSSAYRIKGTATLASARRITIRVRSVD